MSGKQGKSHPTRYGYRPLHEGYTPKETLGTGKPRGGYQPTTDQGTTTAPGSVPKQPSSEQPPKK